MDIDRTALRAALEECIHLGHGMTDDALDIDKAVELIVAGEVTPDFNDGAIADDDMVSALAFGAFVSGDARIWR